MPEPVERYEPLPGLLELPGYLWRKLSPRGRKVAGAIGLLALAGLIAATIVLVPRISDARRHNAAAERQASRLAVKRAVARLVREQRPRRGRAPQGQGRPAMVASVETAITRDTAARMATGELEHRARSTTCKGIGRESGHLVLGCTAVTSEVKTSEDVSGVLVGYSYRAAVSPATGRFAFCKTSGHPALGFSADQLRAVALPRVCGG